jgi:maltose O-acetyltransferase
MYATEFQKYAGTYLSIEDDAAYAKYMKLRHAFLPNLSDTCIIDNGFHADYGHNIYGGKDSLINFNNTFLDSVEIKIGTGCYFGPNVLITDATHPMNKLERTAQHGTISKRVTIGDYVWICGNATICQGVNVGNGCIVAANTCIRHDVPADSVVAGPEGKVICSLSELRDNALVAVQSKWRGVSMQ